MAYREQKVTVMGGVMGPLGIPELKEARNGLTKMLGEPPTESPTEIETDALNQLLDHLNVTIEEHLSVGRRF